MILYKWLVDILGFSRSEAKGTSILLIVVLMTAIIPRLYFSTYFSAKNKSLSLEDEKELLAWKEEIDASFNPIDADKEVIKSNPANFRKQTILEPSPFDPNTVSAELLISFGLDDYLATRIEKYTANGGRFYQSDDLLKIYGMEQAVYDQLSPFITIEKKIKPETYSVSNKEPKLEKRSVLDINLATKNDLIVTRGIGEKLSERILNYRNRLGGFHSINQLYEVYGLDSVVVSRLKEGYFIEQLHHTININSDSIKDLSSHPYIDFKLARAVINYRKTHGDYTHLDELKSIKILNDSTFQKILPYLRLNP